MNQLASDFDEQHSCERDAMKILTPIFWRGSACIWLPLVLFGALRAQDTKTTLPIGAKWRVRLLSPLRTDFNRKGDMVSARVLEPSAFQGVILEGIIRDVKSGGNSARVASIQFDFVTLHANNKALPVSAVLLEALNSRREPGVDEDGSVLESVGTGKVPKLSGVFARGGSRTVRLTSKSDHLSLASGSEFVLQLSP